MRKYIHRWNVFCCIYIGAVTFILLQGYSWEDKACCMLDGCVYMMRPLNYSIIMLVPVIVNTVFSFRHELSCAYVLKYQSWKDLLYEQLKRAFFYAVLYAGFFIFAVCLVQHFLPFYNWNKAYSYFAWKADGALRFSAVEAVLYLLLMCVLRSFFMQGILLLFVWLGNVMPGICILCAMSCFEITQGRIGMFYRIISSEYTVWNSRKSRILLLAGVLFYLLAGAILYRYAVKRKEMF